MQSSNLTDFVDSVQEGGAVHGVNTNDLVQRSLKSVWHPCTQMQHHESTPLIAVSRGEGAWLYGTDGRRYLDAISSWWVNLFGHANPRINSAIKSQLDRLEHAMLAGFTHSTVVELSETLSDLTNNVLGHVFYASDGASAVEIALKMSFHYWKNTGLASKQEFICVKGGYHGETIGALSVTDVPIFKTAYAELIKNTHVVMSPDYRQIDLNYNQNDAVSVKASKEVAALKAAQEFEDLLKARADFICAVILEPLVQCAGGMAMHDPVYLERVRALCDQYGVHLIADEIAVGCGRTGTFFAFEQANCWPDFVCLSKGISGGYLPLSLVMTKDEIYRAFYDSKVSKAFLHSHSYTGNPLACSAALATLAIFREDQTLKANTELSRNISKALEPLKSDHRVKHFRNQGMIWAFDACEQDPALEQTFSRRFFAKALEHELLLRPIGTTVYFMPPYILDDAQVQHLAQRTIEVFDTVMR